MNTQKTTQKIGLEILYNRQDYTAQQIVNLIQEFLGVSTRVKTPIHYPITGKEVKRILKTDDPLTQYGWTVAFVNGQLVLTLDFDDICSPTLEKIKKDFLTPAVEEVVA